MGVSLIYQDPISGGQLYQGAAADIPGTPANFTFNWQEASVRDQIGEKLKKTGVKLLILASKEYLPIINNGFTRVIRLPLVDDLALPGKDLAQMAELAELAKTHAAEAAQMVGNGQRVLVTCWLGDSRSSMISAIIVRHLTTCSASEAIGFLLDQRHIEAFENNKLREIVEQPLINDCSGSSKNKFL